LKTKPINISKNPNVIENVLIRASCSPDKIQTYTALFKEFHDIFAWNYEEMLGIDHRIIKHEIKTYENVKRVHQKMQPINPQKAATIKVEVEKLLKDRFIHLVIFTKWVSNLISVNRKQETIHMCMDFMDLKKSFLKENYPMLFIKQIIDECSKSEIFLFMDVFFLLQPYSNSS